MLFNNIKDLYQNLEIPFFSCMNELNFDFSLLNY